MLLTIYAAFSFRSTDRLFEVNRKVKQQPDSGYPFPPFCFIQSFVFFSRLQLNTHFSHKKWMKITISIKSFLSLWYPYRKLLAKWALSTNSSVSRIFQQNLIWNDIPYNQFNYHSKIWHFATKLRYKLISNDGI